MVQRFNGRWTTFYSGRFLVLPEEFIELIDRRNKGKYRCQKFFDHKRDWLFLQNVRQGIRLYDATALDELVCRVMKLKEDPGASCADIVASLKPPIYYDAVRDHEGSKTLLMPSYGEGVGMNVILQSSPKGDFVYVKRA
jgi:hypothetical protein